ncbi:Protein decapentaplegic, partial [Gryllus bimaculatus]
TSRKTCWPRAAAPGGASPHPDRRLRRRTIPGRSSGGRGGGGGCGAPGGAAGAGGGAGAARAEAAPRETTRSERTTASTAQNTGDFGLSVNASADGGRGGAPLCQRKMLQVDFSAIGWEKFIVAPQSFEAHYCAGDCPFPIAEELRPTNHATLQSLVRQLGEPVPAPCCVPDHLSSLSLLYLDSSGDVVLKNYPNMAVESCACR